MTTAAASMPDLDRPYPLTPEQIRQFQTDGFIKLKEVLSAQTLAYFEARITEVTHAHDRNKDVPLDQRDTYGKAFIQVENVWTMDEQVKEFAFSRRLARIAAELMGCAGVRMWHDQALYKEASGGFTPWHVDQQYWPMASGLCVTAWIPLQATPIEMGPLCFGRGSHLKNIGRDLAISDESERQIREAIKAQGVLEVYEPYELREVSFHYGWTLHRAGPNTTTSPRKVFTIIYMDEQMKLGKPKNDAQQKDWETWTPSTKLGDVMDDPKNPVLYSA